MASDPCPVHGTSMTRPDPRSTTQFEPFCAECEKHIAICSNCGEEYDMRELAAVIRHEHRAAVQDADKTTCSREAAYSLDLIKCRIDDGEFTASEDVQPRKEEA